MKCLACYNPLPEGVKDYHKACSRKLFGSDTPPMIPYDLNQIDDMARQTVSAHIAVTGVQPKLSMDIQTGDTGTDRFTIVGLWGGYILKPPFDQFPHLPENEDLTMNLAGLFGIMVVPHALIRMRSGELAYITRRIDRTEKGKLHMEDACQLTERLTEDKYKGSMEQVGRSIIEASDRPGLDAVNFFELALFCFLTGNADMHRKNFSLIYNSPGRAVMSPAYDLVATKIAMPEDMEESALMINGKKSKLKLRDFDSLAEKLGLKTKQIDNVYKKFKKTGPKVVHEVRNSFLTDPLKEEYQTLFQERFDRLFH